MARYYSSAMGLFMSPDWSAKAEPVPYAKLDDPQSLNLNAYVRNNPLTRVDLDGHTDPDPNKPPTPAGGPGLQPDEGAPGPSLLGTGDIDTMQAMASIRIPDSSMTPLLTCLFSEASGHWGGWPRSR